MTKFSFYHKNFQINVNVDENSKFLNSTAQLNIVNPNNIHHSVAHSLPISNDIDLASTSAIIEAIQLSGRLDDIVVSSANIFANLPIV